MVCPEPVTNPLAQPRAEHHLGFNLCVIERLDLWYGVRLPLHYLEHAHKIQIAAIGRHPPLTHVDDARFENVGGLVGRATGQGAGEEFHDCGRETGLLLVDAGRVQPTSFGVYVGGDGVGAEDMAGEGVELRGAIPEEEGESDGGEGVVVGVVGGVCENHFFLVLLQILLL